MRRSEREITDPRLIERFISKQQIMRIGLYDNSEVYVVPVNYGYESVNGAYTFYFHGAKAGRKYALAQSEPCVGFEIDGEYELQAGEIACAYSAKYMSVIGNGTLSVLKADDEKIKGLNCLMRQTTDQSGFTYKRESLNAVAVFKLEVKKLSCKAKR